jgi:hypothetical protein
MKSYKSLHKGPDRLDAAAAKLEGLRESDPDAAVTLAIDLVAKERAHRVLEPALAILREHPRLTARPALRARFSDLAENGMRYDQGCQLRVAIVQALRAIGLRDDADVAERGLRTVQLGPPIPVDVAQLLRAQSLFFLSEIEPERAVYFAVDLLSDPHTSAFSGEPAVTAIQVLAAEGHLLPIWALARRPGLPPDVLAQAFASLRRVPVDLQTEALLGHLTAALDRGEDGEPTALVAAEAIVLNHLAAGYPTVLRLLRETPNRNLFLYLATATARNGDAEARELLAVLRRETRDPEKRAILDETLGQEQSGRRR